MNANPLNDLIGALVRMNTQEIVSAAAMMESAVWPEEFLKANADDLRRAAGLAKTSLELWTGICELGALDSAGYSALGVPAGLEATQTGAFRG